MCRSNSSSLVIDKKTLEFAEWMCENMLFWILPNCSLVLVIAPFFLFVYNRCWDWFSLRPLIVFTCGFFMGLDLLSDGSNKVDGGNGWIMHLFARGNVTYGMCGCCPNRSYTFNPPYSRSRFSNRSSWLHLRELFPGGLGSHPEDAANKF